MRRWLILITCGFTGLPVIADIPEPGMMALASTTTPTIRAVDETVPPVAAKQKDKPAPAPVAKVPVPAPQPEVKNVPDDGGIRDTLNVPHTKATPDVVQKPLAAFAEVDYLRKHNDGTMAVSYLRQVVQNRNILPQDRAQAILTLADTLDSEHQEAESLCWLKIWMQLFPTRPEYGAVAYRVGTIYTRMGLPDMARDAYYMTLAHTINDGQVQSEEDLKQYTRLTIGTLWALAANEYQAGQWARAAELLKRYRVEAETGSPASLEKAAFLQADCYYQLHQTDDALALYEETLEKHPFNAMAPAARLRLYHLYMVKKQPEKAKEDMQALAWTVRTVWPKDETYWQKETAQMLLALNQKNAEILPPLFKESSKLSPEGKSWQDAINHYDALVGYQAVLTQGIMNSHVNSTGKGVARTHLPEDDELLAMNKTMNKLLP